MLLLEYVITYVYVYGVVFRPYTYILVLPRRGLFSTLYNTEPMAREGTHRYTKVYMVSEQASFCL
jgi:hypothetical protein